MFKNCLRWSAGALAGGALLLGATSAFAGSDNSSDTYAGDVNGLALPACTFLVLNYTGYRHSDEYAASTNNIFSKTSGGKQEFNSTGEIVTDILRFRILPDFGTILWFLKQPYHTQKSRK